MRNSKIQFKMFLKSTIAVLMAIVLFVSNYSGVLAFADNKKIDELEQRIKAAKEEKQKTQETLEEYKQEMDTLNSTASTLREALSELNVELERVSKNVAEIEGKINSKNEEIDDIELDLKQALEIENEQYEAMKKRIKFMYENKNYDMFNALTDSEIYGRNLNAGDYFLSVAAYDRKMLDEYKHTREVIEEAREFLDEERGDLDVLMQAALEEQERILVLVERTNKSIENYEKEIESTEQEMEENENLLAEQNENIAALQKELNEEKRLSELANNSAWRNISQVSYAGGDRDLLAAIIYCEAGNQSYEGQLAVGAVVMNRVRSSVFPDSIVGVIYQNKQFSPVASGRLALALANGSATESCYQAADAAMAGQNNVGSCLFFRTPIEGLNGIRIDGHVFY